MNAMRSFAVYAFMLILCIGSTMAQNWQSWLNCNSPRKMEGRCVHYRDCSYALKFEQDYGINNLPDNIRTFLLDSRCTGADPNQFSICCELPYIQPLASAVRPTPATTTTTTARSIVRRTNTQSVAASANDDVLYASNRGNFEATLNGNVVRMLKGLRCGITNTNRVAFGNKTVVGEYPWMALLRYDTPNRQFQCGGSLISSRFVISAAHCMVGLSDNLIGVRLGEHDITSSEDCLTRGEQTVCYRSKDFGIERVIVHPNYSRLKAINDVGLIRLDRDVAFEDTIRPICLPVTNQAAQLTEFPDRYITAGWGTTEIDQPSNVLLQAYLEPKNRGYCQSIFRKASIQLAHICAGGDSRVDACKGDSGGPLFASTLYQRTARYVLFGIVSFGVAKCGDTNSYPGVYTNVAQFMPWVTNQLAKYM